MKFKRTRPDAILPRYHSEGASGMDMHFCGDRPIIIGRGERMKIPTGIAIELPVGLEAQMRPRSGLSNKKLDVKLGTVDSDYRGEVHVLIQNNSDDPYTFQPGDRIAQMVIVPVVRVEIEEVDELTHTRRGSGGFGSTGR